MTVNVIILYNLKRLKPEGTERLAFDVFQHPKWRNYQTKTDISVIFFNAAAGICFAVVSLAVNAVLGGRYLLAL